MQQPRERERIQCLECGRWFRALPRHLRVTHGYSDEDYRLKFGLAVGEPLVCIAWSENARRKARDHQNIDYIPPQKRGGPSKGYRQRESVRNRRAEQYQALAAAGMEASHAKDKTATRREALRPYPVTVEQAMERMQCTKRAAYTFLAYCVQQGKLKRIKRGLYGPVEQD